MPKRPAPRKAPPKKRPKSAAAKRVAQLEARLGEMERRLRARARPAPVPTFQPLPAPGYYPAPSARPRSGFTIVGPGAPPERPDLERVLGGNWLAKAGMAVLVLGVVFFLKLAFDRNWIDLPSRIALGVLGGLVLFGLGDFLLLRRRYGVYPQVLAGGGAVIAYFSLYAAYAFEEYRAATGFTLALDSTLLGAFALGLAGYAVWRRTPALAAESILLGAFASLAAESWGPFAVVYILLLAASTLAAGAWRGWAYVTLATLLAAYATLFLLLVLDVDPSMVMAGSVVLLALFAPVGFRRAAPTPQDLSLPALVAVGSFAATWAVLLVGLTLEALEDGRGPATGLLALAALGLAFARPAALETRQGWGAAGILLALSWPPIQFDGYYVPVAWTALLAVAGLSAWKRPSVWPRTVMAVASVLAVAHLTIYEASDLLDETLKAWVGLIVFLLTTIALFGAWRVEARLPGPSPALARGLLALALFTPLVYLTAALEGYYVSIAWAVEATLFVLIGFTFRIRDLRLAAIAIYGLVLARVFLLDLTALRIEYRVVTFLVVGGLLLAASFLFARKK